MRSNKTRGKYFGSALLRERILALRIEGKTVRAIGAEVGKTPQRVHQILVAALAELNDKALESAAQVVQLEVERLDAMLDSLWRGRADPEVASALLRLMDRRAKLMGLDKPTKTGFVGKDGEFVTPPTLIVEFTDGSSSTAAPETEAAKGV